MMKLMGLLMAMLIGSLASAKGGSSSALNPEALSAKAFLEDVLARRYSQELSTTLDSKSFSLGAQLDLIEVKKKTEIPGGEIEPISDLMLGTLDPEELMKKFGDGGKDEAQGFLQNFRIKTVNVSVGLHEDLAPEVKASVEKWLAARLSGEFGKAGKGNVSFITRPVEKKGPARGFWDWLNQFQALAGQLVMALALLLGVILWGALVAGKGSKNEQESTSNTMASGTMQSAPAAAAAEAAKQEKAERAAEEEEERLKASTEIEGFTRKLNELVPRLNRDLEAILRSWCQMGESGKLRLACFAEAVGREVGRLPIPVDALPEVSRVFAKMTELPLKEKRDALQKAYWDLLTALNLGAETLNQPFGFLGGLNLDMVSNVLIDQNPKMKTLVSLFMPGDLRSRYVQSLSFDEKRTMLENAAQMSEVPTDEFKSLEGTLMGKLKPASAAGVIPLELTLNKMAAALSAMEAVVLLKDMQGPAIEQFKRSTPTLAFLAEWPDEKLSILLAPANSDEIVALSRVRPDLQERMLKLAPPMTSEMATEELAMPDRMQDRQKTELLQSFTERLSAMVTAKELLLEEIFSTRPAEGRPTVEVVDEKKAA